MRRALQAIARLAPAFTGAAAAGLGLSCADCVREGCDALSLRAAAAGTGIAGVVAAESDVVRDGCQECPLASAGLQLWRLDTPIGTQAATALLPEREPDVTQNASGRYALPLEPGPHLLCLAPSCVELVVQPGETLTVNIKLLEGPTRFFVGDPDADLEESVGFEAR